MLRHVLRLNLELKSSLCLLGSKRYKGHSHWQNVRHVKQTNDNKRSALISLYMRKMQGVINARNGDANPASNTALANILEEAKENKLPVSTFQGFLKKLTDRELVPHQVFYKGPENYVLAITYDKKRQQFFRQALKKACRDYKVLMQEVSNVDDVFTLKGIIVSKAPSSDTTLEQAEETAILAGAEDVEDILSPDKNEKVFQFTTFYEDLFKVVGALREQGWTMYEHKHELVPNYCIELPEEKMSQLHDLVTAIEEIPEVDKVIVNIA